jgi:hypothetical protein
LDSKYLTIAFLGNSISDYDDPQTITITIGKAQVIPSQQDNLTTQVILPAINEETP